jgi:serine/threonine-protein kinase
MSSESQESGRVIAGRYRLETLLGRGGMGSVWRAEHLTLGSEVAVKLIDPSVASHPEVRARFVREAKAAAQLRSPHVVQILDYGVDGDTPFIAMELMVGESLSSRLDRVGRLSAEETSRIVTEIARALGKAHEAGIIHRDLKPDNVFLVRNDDTEIAKVLDFGVAKKQAFGTDEAHMTSTGAVLGTPYYMSPEQAEGLKDLDHRTDIWALAVIAYECLVGVRPFDGDTLGGVFLSICARPKPVPSLVRPDLPAGFDAWFERGTARLMADRFPTAREAAQALKDLVLGASAGTDLRQSSAGLRAETSSTMLGGPRTVTAAGTPAAVTGADETKPLVESTGGLGATALPLPVRRSVLPAVLGAAVVLLAFGAIAFRLRGGSEQASADPLVAASPVEPAGDLSASSAPAAPSAPAPSSAPSASAAPVDSAAPARSSAPVDSAAPSAAAATGAPAPAKQTPAAPPRATKPAARSKPATRSSASATDDAVDLGL